MNDGLYEKILDDKSNRQLLDKNYKKFRSIDDSELSRVISTTYQKIIRETLSQIEDTSEKIKFINNINRTIGIDDFGLENNLVQELLTAHNDENSYNILNNYRPKTSIATSTLFTGNSGPSLESELRREIRTSDKVDFLVSFIKFSGLRLIYDDLVEFTKHNKLRVITTSYMGASQI